MVAGTGPWELLDRWNEQLVQHIRVLIPTSSKDFDRLYIAGSHHCKPYSRLAAPNFSFINTAGSIQESPESPRQQPEGT
jgi:hypothetical protein